MGGSKKWEQHVLCTRLIRQNPEWTNAQVLEAAGMKPLEEGIVAEARREVECSEVPGDITWSRSY